MIIKEEVGDWYEPFKDLWESKGLAKLLQWTEDLRSKTDVYPVREDIFKAFKLCPLFKVKVIFLGLSPYHTSFNGIPYANGLAFDCSNPSRYEDGVQMTPSWEVMYKEYTRCYPSNFRTDLLMGNLEKWAKDGTLLLNAGLTVEKGFAKSHNHAWEPFTVKFLKRFHSWKKTNAMNPHQRNVPVVAFGNDAYEICKVAKYDNFGKVLHPAAAARNNEPWEIGHGFFHEMRRKAKVGLINW